MNKHQLDPGHAFFGNSVDVDMKLQDLEGFLAVVASFLDEKAQSVENASDEMGMDESYMFSGTFPSILYSSMIITVVSLLESETRGFSSQLKDASGATLGIRDLSGSWLERFRKYCERVAGLDLALEQSLWNDMNGVVEIRNCLVHAAGYVVGFAKEPQVHGFAKRHGTPIIGHGYIECDFRMAELALKTVRTFIEVSYKTALSRFPYPSSSARRRPRKD